MGEHLINSLYDYLMLEEEEERRYALRLIEKKKQKALKKQ